jgi:hypothetical protein
MVSAGILNKENYRMIIYFLILDFVFISNLILSRENSSSSIFAGVIILLFLAWMILLIAIAVFNTRNFIKDNMEMRFIGIIISPSVFISITIVENDFNFIIIGSILFLVMALYSLFFPIIITNGEERLENIYVPDEDFGK